MIYIAITSYFLPIEIIIYLFPVETIRHELGFFSNTCPKYFVSNINFWYICNIIVLEQYIVLFLFSKNIENMVFY